MTITLPPLRQRKEDIPPLVHHLMKRIARAYQLSPCLVSQDALEILMDQAWPGNIRELESVIRNSMMFANGKTISAKTLKSNGLLQAQQSDAKLIKSAKSSSAPALNSEEKLQLIACLRRHSLDKKLVAEELGITPKSVYMRMAKLGIPKKNSLLVKYLDGLA
jgi:two-component system response regulator PilR (NtrC family)